MATVTHYTRLYDVDMEIVPSKTQVVIGTEAMSAGGSSDNMEYLLYRGTPPNLYVLMHTMRCVYYCLNAKPGPNVFKIHISFNTLVTMFI